MNRDWIRIYSTGQGHLAELLKQSLERADTPVVIMNKKDSSYLFGSHEVHVDVNFQQSALEILDQFKKDLDIE